MKIVPTLCVGMPLRTLRVRLLERRASNTKITMSKFFDDLIESVQQMNEIISGEREPSREFHIEAL
jgi:hypothetical protein